MKIIIKHRTTIGLSLIILLFFLGVSYGAWSDILSVRGIVTTANFSVEFENAKEIKVHLVTMDANNNITSKERISDFSSTNNNNKNINLSLYGGLVEKMKTHGYMLQIEYPLKTTINSKIKAIKSEKANFSKPYEVINVAPDFVNVIINDKKININERINIADYKISFNIYRQIETNDNNDSSAVIFVEVANINEVASKNIGSIEYQDLLGYDDYSYLESSINDYSNSTYNTIIDAKLNAEYSLNIPIVAEQFNTGE